MKKKTTTKKYRKDNRSDEKDTRQTKKGRL